MRISSKNKKHIFIIAFLVLLQIAIICFYYALSYMHISADAEKYLKQFAAIAAYGEGLLTIWLLFKYFLKNAMKLAGKKVKKQLQRAIRFVSGKINSLMTKMGLKRGKNLAVGSDEYSFTFDDDAIKSRKLSVSEVKKWKDLTDNNEKLRFLFIRYMLRKIRKGYRKRRGKTPREWARELHLEGEHLEFFENYNSARYSGGRELVSDSALLSAQSICERKKG